MNITLKTIFSAAAEEVTLTAIRANHYESRIGLFAECLDGEPYAALSVNLPDEPMEQDEVAIKNYSENQGFLEQLLAQQIVAAPHRFVDSGFVRIGICRLLHPELRESIGLAATPPR